MDKTYYEVRTIYGKTQKCCAAVTVPGSKSITNRALLIATLADGESLLKGALFSDDSRYFLKCIQDLGFAAEADETAKTIRVKGLNGRIPKKEASVYVGSAGTAARFLTAFLGMSEGAYCLDASEQMRKRPMKPLLDTLTEIGARIHFLGEEGYFPFQIRGGGISAGEICVNIDHSSQFLSALLISACLADRDLRIRVEGSHGMSYIHMTVRMMEEFGIHAAVEQEKGEDGQIRDVFYIEGGQHYRAADYQIEPDVSAAAYFYGLAAVLGTKVLVRNVAMDCRQGDIEFIRILKKMGCRYEETSEGLAVCGPEDGNLKGVTADMHTCSDQAITLAAIAPFADSPVTITGIGHIRYQESDRISAIAAELKRMGIRCEEREDSITVYPGNPQPSLIETYDDHRMAMGFSLTGLRAEGIRIADPKCCKKTFENYFEVLDGILAELAG